LPLVPESGGLMTAAGATGPCGSTSVEKIHRSHNFAQFQAEVSKPKTSGISPAI
jgi:hypothetical protein